MEVPLISFTISGTTYQAEEGMTWQEWVDSSYNTSNGRYAIIAGYLQWGDGHSIYGPTATSSDSALKATDTPQANGIYTESSGGGSAE